MSQLSNPFIRGYQNLSIGRTLAISTDDDQALIYRTLHESQIQLHDQSVVCHRCIFNDDHALVIDGQDIPNEIASGHSSSGIVRAVIYAVMCEEGGQPIHIGDTYSWADACAVIQRLKFETGHYSRAWEISKSHLTEEANQYLEELADSPTPLGLLFEVFRIPDGHCIGVKLVSTPWTDRNLELIDGRSSVELLQEQQSAGVPELLLEVLHLASRADTRFLVFDPDAPLLAGLPVIVD